MKFRFSRHILEKRAYQIPYTSVWWEHGCSLQLGGETDRQTWRSWQSLFAVLQGCLMTLIKKNSIPLLSKIVR